MFESSCNNEPALRNYKKGVNRKVATKLCEKNILNLNFIPRKTIL